MSAMGVQTTVWIRECFLEEVIPVPTWSFDDKLRINQKRRSKGISGNEKGDQKRGGGRGEEEGNRDRRRMRRGRSRGRISSSNLGKKKKECGPWAGRRLERPGQT